MSERPPLRTPRAWADLPDDELRHYAADLGLAGASAWSREELLAQIEARRRLIASLERDALLDIVVWARRPVRRSADNEELAREIARIGKMDFRGLSYRGLVALARLRGLEVRPDEPFEILARRMRRAEPLTRKLRRKRREWAAAVISRLLTGAGETQEYTFLPEGDNAAPTIRDDIATEGVVGGIARRIRGAADDYIREKLNEIEQRIDAKLDDIDRRLQEWRDREVAHRLRLIRLTLLITLVVAVLSLGYSIARRRWVEAPTAPAPAARTPDTPSP